MKSWKTSVFGLAAGVLNLLANGSGWKEIALSTAITLLGLSSKDHNVTGGTT
jgi:hypothetical protein